MDNEKSLDERYKEAILKATIHAKIQDLAEGGLKMVLRDEFAKAIMAGIIAADWKFDLTEKKWDEIAARRAYELADAMIKEREINNV
jgi:hypothetical protein